MIGLVAWLPQWKDSVLRLLFQILRHNSLRVSVAEYLTLKPLVGSRFYAAVSYLFWRAQDERTLRCRTLFLLAKIAEFLHWERNTKQEGREWRFAELGRCLWKVQNQEYWRLENNRHHFEECPAGNVQAA